MLGEQMDERTEGLLGTVTIDPGVLVTIARLSALSTSGVCHMSAQAPGRILGLGRAGEGVRVEIDDHAVAVDLYVVMKSGENMREAGRNVQNGVTRAIREMVGMAVREVNVHIEDVRFPCPEPPVQGTVA